MKRNVNLLLSLILITLALSIEISCVNSKPRKKLSLEKATRVFGGKVKTVIEYKCDQYWQNQNPIRVYQNSCKIKNFMEYSKDEALISESDWFFNEYPEPPDNKTDNRLNWDLLLNLNNNLILRYYI